MRMVLRVLAMLLVSVALFSVGVWTFNHQSSAAFELGLFLCAAGLLHWVFWPDITDS